MVLDEEKEPMNEPTSDTPPADDAPNTDTPDMPAEEGA